MIDLLLTLGLAATLTGAAVPQLLAALDEFRTYGAAMYMSGRLHEVRMTAVARGANAAMRFTRSERSYAYSVYLDGNWNGVRGADISEGIDPEIRQEEHLSDLFPGVDFGAVPDLPVIEPGDTSPGVDPVRFGATNMAAFSALGTSTPGTLYIRGRNAQYAVRLFGQTGKIRVLKFDSHRHAWKQL